MKVNAEDIKENSAVFHSGNEGNNCKHDKRYGGMKMYNVESYNKTTMELTNKKVKTEEDASRAARAFIDKAKDNKAISESAYDISPRGYVIGQTIITEAGEFRISTAKY